MRALVERAVILSNDGVLSNPLPATPTSQAISDQRLPIVTRGVGKFMDSQRALILDALRETDWAVGGSGDAAARLGLKRTTLIANEKTRHLPAAAQE